MNSFYSSQYKEKKFGCRLAKPKIWEIITHLTTSDKPSSDVKLTALAEKRFLSNSLS
jgi:hypothetical protein